MHRDLLITNKIMYIDERLIKILEPHLGETIEVSYAIRLVKQVAKEYESQCNNSNLD